MSWHPALLRLALLPLLFLPACLFSIDDDLDAGPPSGDDEPIDSPLELSGPSSPLLIDDLSTLSLHYHFSCHGELCSDQWTCTFTQDDANIDLDPCTSPLYVTDDTFDEGRHTMAVEMLSDAGDTYHESLHTTVLQDFELHLESPMGSSPISLDDASTIDVTSSCDHPQCQPNCQWIDPDDGTSIGDPHPCPPNENTQLEPPHQGPLELRALACITDLPGLDDDAHCRQSNTLEFEP